MHDVKKSCGPKTVFADDPELSEAITTLEKKSYLKMKTNTDSIFVKSHVARDLMQSAGLFKTDKLVVWEYVSNSSNISTLELIQWQKSRSITAERRLR